MAVVATTVVPRTRAGEGRCGHSFSHMAQLLARSGLHKAERAEEAIDMWIRTVHGGVAAAGASKGPRQGTPGQSTPVEPGQTRSSPSRRSATACPR